jgi:SAM-dependent methyltransferase
VTFKDHFSERAPAYARARPVYPPALFEQLAMLAAGHDLVWDAGTGSGQAALGLVQVFRRVHATDASAAQLAEAPTHPRIDFQQATADRSGLPDHAADLVTVAQAAHWFDLQSFYTEALRVLKPGGLLALWCYGLCEITPEIDGVVERFYRETVGPWWPPERRHVERGYASLPFPLPEFPFPVVIMVHEWTLPEFLDYVGTWSAATACRRHRGEDPVAPLGRALTAFWGPPDRPRTLRWPLRGRIGRTTA